MTNDLKKPLDVNWIPVPEISEKMSEWMDEFCKDTVKLFLVLFDVKDPYFEHRNWLHGEEWGIAIYSSFWCEKDFHSETGDKSNFVLGEGGKPLGRFWGINSQDASVCSSPVWSDRLPRITHFAPLNIQTGHEVKHELSTNVKEAIEKNGEAIIYPEEGK